MRWAASTLLGGCVAAGLTIVALAGAAPPLPESGSYDLAEDVSTRMAGPGGEYRAGWSVAMAGDVNGDGQGDVIVGAPHTDVGGATQAGAAYVVFGPVAPGELTLDDPTSGGFRIDGAAPGDWAGWSVAPVGDVNGDGRTDLAVGAPFADRGAEPNAGATYIVFGKEDSAAVSLAALAGKGLVLTGAGADERSGFSVARVRDLNSDGVPELLIGAPTAGAQDDGTGPDVLRAPGAAYLVFSSAFTGDVDLGALGTNGFRIAGSPESVAGVSVAGAPDLNGDARPELVIGAPGLPVADDRPGGAFIVWGKDDANPIDLDALGDGGFVISGGKSAEIPEGKDPPENARTASRWAGRDVAVLPDVNGDSVADIIIGAPHTRPKQRRSAGAAYVVFGKGSTSSVDLSRLQGDGIRILGAADGDLAGWSVGPAGDFDGDGKQDVLLGAPAADALSRDLGGAGYVVFNHALTEDVDLAGLGESGVRIVGAEAGDTAGRSIAAVGDLSGDGVGDVLVGTPGDAQTGADLLNGPKEEPPPPPDEPQPPPPDPGVEEEEEIDGCRAVNNVEFVVDDSGSMEDTDPEKLRAQAIRLLVAKERNAEEVLGAVQFGRDASQLFPPTTIDPFGKEDNRSELLDALARIDADEGSTNYNAAFRVLADENPGAGARIFLTDGAHNVGEYRELHRGGPPTFVLGFQIDEDSNDGERLQRIADETDGRYFPNVTTRTLQRAVNAIDSRLNCDIELDVEPDPYKEEGDIAHDAVPLDKGVNSADIVVSWGDAGDDFELAGLAYKRGTHTIARIGRRGIARALRGSGSSSARAQSSARRLHVAGRRGKTFIALRATGLSRGRLVYRIRAKKLNGAGRTDTQISQSRRVR